MEFNDRVFQLAEDDQVPLLERVKFLAIRVGNLDEFFMVRVAGPLKRVAPVGEYRGHGNEGGSLMTMLNHPVMAGVKRLRTVACSLG